MTAFDYATQTWVFGASGAALQLAQTQATLALLRGERGADYAVFIGLPAERLVAHVADLEDQVRQLVALRDACTLSPVPARVLSSSEP